MKKKRTSSNPFAKASKAAAKKAFAKVPATKVKAAIAKALFPTKKKK